MAGKKTAKSEPVAAPTTTATSAPPAKASSTPTKNPIPIPTPAQPKAVAAQGGWAQVFQNLYDYYLAETPQRTKLLDVFLLFLALVGALQFLYCILAGNYPFNAFLSGFCGTVGQFVLTISLRIQTTEANKADFPKVSPERAFADYVVCSLILHFFCVNFIN